MKTILFLAMLFHQVGEISVAVAQHTVVAQAADNEEDNNENNDQNTGDKGTPRPKVKILRTR